MQKLGKIKKKRKFVKRTEIKKISNDSKEIKKLKNRCKKLKKNFLS